MRTTIRRPASLALLLIAATALAGCVAVTDAANPEPSADPSPEASVVSPSPSAESSASAEPSHTPGPSEASGAPAPGDDIALPATCREVYSADMFGTLERDLPPLNHADITLKSTEVVEGVEVLGEEPPAVRCTWGTPSHIGLSTTVAIVTPEQAARVRGGIDGSGDFACVEADGGAYCRASGASEFGGFGETHFLRGNGWVSTTWLGYGGDGYSEDIVATLWG